MLRPKRRTATVAAAAVFSSLYAVLGLIPLSKLVIGSGFLTASKVVAPMGGMLFGPVIGSATALLGDFIDVGLNRIVLDAFGWPIIVSDVVIAATAGLAFLGKRAAAVGLFAVILIAYLVDPVSVLVVEGIPFFWFHVVGLATMAGALVIEAKGRIARINPVFIGAVALGSELSGHIAGTLAGQTLQVQVYQVLDQATWNLRTEAFFWLYPLERSFFAALCFLVAYPVLRSLSRWRGGPRVS